MLGNEQVCEGVQLCFTFAAVRVLPRCAEGSDGTQRGQTTNHFFHVRYALCSVKPLLFTVPVLPCGC